MTMRYAHLSPDVRRDAVQLVDLKAPPARFDCGPLRGPTLTANGMGAEPGAITAEPAPWGHKRGTWRVPKEQPPGEPGG